MRFHKNNASIEGTERFKTFTDGFMAIVMTVLVLEFHVPKIDVLTSSAALTALAPLLPKFIVFLASFICISIYWVNHHHLSHSLKKTDGILLWHNIHMMFWMSLIPFVTAFIGDYPTIPLAVSLYSFILCMTTFSATIMLRYIYMKSDLISHEISLGNRQILLNRQWIGVTLYAASIFSAFISPYISYFVFILVTASFLIPQRVEEVS